MECDELKLEPMSNSHRLDVYISKASVHIRFTGKPANENIISVMKYINSNDIKGNEYSFII